MKHYRAKTKETIKVVKYTGDNRQFLIDNSNGLVEEPWIENENVDRLWVNNFDGGDVFYVGQYLVQDSDYDAHSIESNELESKYVYTGNDEGIFQIWQEKEYLIVEAIKWNGYNTDEVSYFLKGKGTLDKSGSCFVIMNFSGGSVAFPGDYVICSNGEYWTMKDTYFESAFVGECVLD